MAEKVELVERWKRREPLDSIARDYGVSPGMVSTIAIQEFGNPPHVKRKSREPVEVPEPLPELEPEVAAEPLEEPEPALGDVMAELRADVNAARREMAEMRREFSKKLDAFELAMVRFAAKKPRRRDDAPQLSWPFSH